MHAFVCDQPNDADLHGMTAFATTEGAKRRVLAVLLDIGLPVREGELSFDLSSSTYEPVVTGPPQADSPDLMAAPATIDADGPFSEIIGTWLPLTYALNAMNRSMGLQDRYPFVLAPRVIDKLAFAHNRVLVLACSSPSA